MKAYRKILLVVILFWQTTYLMGQNNHVKVIKTITREVDGKMVELRLDGKFEKVFNHSNLKLPEPVSVKELYPGILFYKKGFTHLIKNDEKKEYNWTINDRIEFFDEEYNSIKVFNIRENNPFLLRKNKIRIKENYHQGAEYLQYFSKEKRTGSEKVSELWLNTFVQQDLGFSHIIYTIDSLSESKIIGTTSYLIVLDSIGKRIFEHEKNTSIGFPILDRSGNYLTYGLISKETASNAGMKLQPDGFEIWNIKSKKLIFRELNANADLWLGGMENTSNNISNNSEYLRIEFTFPYSEINDSKQFIFDPNTGVLYSRVFSIREWSEISKNWIKKYKQNYENLLIQFEFEQNNL